MFFAPLLLLILVFVQCGNPNLAERSDIENFKLEAVKKAKSLPIKIIGEGYKAIIKALPDFVWPVARLECGIGYTPLYGYRTNPIEGYFEFHEGVDYTGSIGDPVWASGNGIVEKSYFDRLLGNCIRIKHDKSIKTVYAHLDKTLVKVGEEVKVGYQIATLGNSGASSKPHIHYEIWQNGKTIDPEEFMRRQKQPHLLTLETFAMIQREREFLKIKTGGQLKAPCRVLIYWLISPGVHLLLGWQ